MKKQVLFIILLLTFGLLSAQLPLSYNLKGFGGIGVDQGFIILTDHQDNVILGGYFRDQVNFNNANKHWDLKSNGSEDIFISKYNKEGELIWANAYGTIGPDRCNSAAIDSKDNIYIIGNFRDTVEFRKNDPNATKNSFGINDIFVAKFDPQGKLIWVKQIGGIKDDVGNKIVVDQNDEIIITGNFQSSITFEGTNASFNLTAIRNSDIFVAKLDPDGNFLWTKQIGGANDELANALAVDQKNEITLMGTFQANVDFDPGPNQYILNLQGVYPNMFVLKLNSNGNFVWVKQIVSENIVIPYNVVTDSDNHIYSVGTFRSATDFDPGADSLKLVAPNVSGDAFVLKLDASGNLIWVRQLGGDHNEIGIGIALDKNNNVYTTGCYEDMADFDPGPNQFLLNTNQNPNNNDIFISKLNSNGEFVWADGINGELEDIGFSICVNSKEAVYVTGIYSGKVIHKVQNDSTILLSNGGTDILYYTIDQIISSNQNLPIENTFNVFPNPITSFLKINFISTNSHDGIIEIDDINGKIISKQNFKCHLGENEFSMSRNLLKSGTFILSFIQDGKRISQKLIIP